jgi:hypothetical protein
MICMGEPRSERRYVILSIATFAVSCFVYLQTLAPSVSTIFDDSLELQLVSYQLGIAHPTGYPLYVILGKLFTLLPVGTVAYRVNLLSALCGALTAVGISLIVAKVSGRHLAGFAAGIALAISPVFWSQSTIAEVYTLNSLFIVAIVYCAILWGDKALAKNFPQVQTRKWFWLLAFVFGLALTHHRTIVFLLPALLAFMLLVNRRFWRDTTMLAGAIACVVIPQVLYLYIPLRGIHLSSLDGTYENTLAGFLRQVIGLGYNVFLTGNPLEQSRGVMDYVRWRSSDSSICSLNGAGSGR